ncbi:MULTISPECIES: riboflavin synthase [unclassified Guyparkeria]|uniref:riboflavin synthase n=1 Tax=unclassified Guyparkeria TaxID=2626246 RepID=UPI0007339A91|nr:MULTISPECIES: riboflavin synthase [unclassified Guyparkeria]KTG16377.1 riboflavin synthase subunit alpha [Guyparkeria sp. XI15]OAE85317.1 riboflavin synthase subunit alpha [Guyparkeria sp. WRN-7]
MFTGIIQTVGTLVEQTPTGGDARLTIEAPGLDLANTAIGDSIAVNGVCLTVTDLDGDRFSVDCSAETLRLTTVGQLAPGSRVNLEPALTLATPLGGHLVSGHVDGLAIVDARRSEARATEFWLRVPPELARYVAKKGSLAIDGVSLTVNEVSGVRCRLTIIPHTLEATIMGEYRPGRQVNLEVDLMARYLERLLQAGEAQGGKGGQSPYQDLS